MNEEDKLKEFKLPDGLKQKLLKFIELKKQADLRKEHVKSINDKEINKNEPGKENNSQ